MMNKATDWMPLVRHNHSQNTGVVYTLVLGETAVLDVPMRVLPSRFRGESPALRYSLLRPVAMLGGARPLTRASLNRLA